MNRITTDTLADLFFQVNWKSDGVQHTDAYAGRHVNIWRDHLPRRLYQTLLNKASGDQFSLALTPGELMDSHQVSQLKLIKREQFDATRMGGTPKSPRMGRFYPKGVLKDVAGVFRANTEPFRCVRVNNGHIEMEMGHPLAHSNLALNVMVGTVQEKTEERGGTMRDWGDIITHGVGMQSRWLNHPTDFFSNHPFQRADEWDDNIFYEKPRLVQHIDDAAIDILKQLYGRFLENGHRVLDLMSSWQSHLPGDTTLSQLSGLGLNEVELQKNPHLSDYKVHDLNENPKLPYDNGSYDVVVCSLSVEYLTQPFKIFKEIARVLQPGGMFVVTFSNRWFAPKSIRIWTELHEFERMGLVVEYFKKDHLFEDLHTYSIRGLERPAYDKYFRQQPEADPIYAVWGRRI